MATEYNVSDCQELDSENSEYTLENDLIAGSNCLNVTAGNITIDCSGHTITYAVNYSGHGIKISGVNNTAVENCIFVKEDNEEPGSAAIYEELGNDTILINNTVNSAGDYSYGIVLKNVQFANITGNKIILSGSYAHGINLSFSESNNITSNAINTSTGNDAYGIALSASAYNNITGNFINTSGTYNGYGMFVSEASHNNSFEKNDILAKGSQGSNLGVYSYGSANFIVRQNVIATSGTNSNHGLYLLGNSYKSHISSNKILAQGTGEDNYGIYVNASGNTNISLNNITTNGTKENYGIHLLGADNTTISQNNITTQGTAEDNYGTYTVESANTTIKQNNIKTNGTLRNYGTYLDSSSHKSSIDSNSIVAKGTNESNYGIIISYSAEANISLNNITTNGTKENYGIHLVDSDRSILRLNSVLSGGNGGSNYGVLLRYSEDVNISQNAVLTSGAENSHGISLAYSSANCIISENIVSAYGSGSWNYAVFANNSNESTLSQNNLTTGTNFSSAVYLLSSEYANITGNIIRTSKNMSFAIKLESSINNTVYNNVFNTTETQINITGSANNNFSIALTSGTNIISGSYIGGNYYDNSTEWGLKAFSCSDADSNGICDAPYEIDDNTTDFYPLVTVAPSAPPVFQNTGSGSSGGSGGFIIRTIEEEEQESASEEKKEKKPKKQAAETPANQSGIPARLFDISFRLEEETIYNSRYLTAWVTFESFGFEPTPVNLTYFVLNESGEVVYTKRDALTVYTEEVVIERFQELKLGIGNYTLVLRTLYDGDVEDEFRGDFRIVETEKALVIWSNVLWWSIFIMILALPLNLAGSEMLLSKRLGKTAPKLGLITPIALLVMAVSAFVVNMFRTFPEWFYYACLAGVFVYVLIRITRSEYRANKFKEGPNSGKPRKRDGRFNSQGRFETRPKSLSSPLSKQQTQAKQPTKKLRRL